MIKISSPVGYEYNVELDDIKTLKNALRNLGYYKVLDYGMTPYPDEKLFSGIRSFQKDNKLKIDGLIKPDGETLIAINKKLSSELPGVKGPTFWCACGAPHGGVYEDICPDCFRKL